MKLPRKKNADWFKIRLEREFKRKINRFSRRLLVKHYISEYVDDVLRTLDRFGVFVERYKYEYCDKDSILAYRLIAMMYGFGFEITYKDGGMFDTIIRITKKNENN